MASIMQQKPSCLSRRTEPSASSAYLTCEQRWIFWLLMFVAGFYGAYTLCVRGGVFCNAQTGNMALLAVSLGMAHGKSAFGYLLCMIGYLLGVMVSEILPRAVRRMRLRWDTLLIMIELVVVLVLGARTIPDRVCQVAINILCAMQYTTFRQAEGIPMATTFCTNHMRLFGTALARRLFRRDLCEKRALCNHGMMMLCFVSGATLSARLSAWLGTYTIWCATVPLTILCVALLKADLTTEQRLLQVAPRGH